MRFKGRNPHEDYYGAAYEEPDMMPQTEAMRHFRLSVDELKPLKVKHRSNPVDPRFAPMKLYRIADLQVRFTARSACRSASLDRTRVQCAAGPIAAHARRYRHMQRREGAVVKLMTGDAHRPARLRRACARALLCLLEP